MNAAHPTLPPLEFARLITKDDLPQWFAVSGQRIDSFLRGTDEFYTTIRLRKRRGSGRRVVYKADSELAAIQRQISRSIALVRMATFKSYVHGFVKGRSIATNAGQHLAKKRVLCVDLRDFFDSVRLPAVRHIFTMLGCGAEAADVLAALCTRAGSLPQGARTSPILANLAAAELDEDMFKLAEATGATYTRYADDLTFSGGAVPKIEDIARVVEYRGFALNDEKTRLQPAGRRQWVTGLVVSDSDAPRVPRRLKKNLRLALHYATQRGLAKHLEHCGPTEANRLRGLILYVNGVEPKLGARLRAQYSEAIAFDNPSSDEPESQG